MSILSDTAIRRAMADERIQITPFDESCLGGNSYDVHLARNLVVYYRRSLVETPLGGGMELREIEYPPLDAAKRNPTMGVVLPEEGGVLVPGRLYLAVTREYTETWDHVPYLDGKSSVGRLGIFTHVTAGRGDVGYCGHWTMEICVVEPVRVYPGMKIGQLTFHTVEGQVERSYHRRTDAKYGSPRGYEEDPIPVPSGMWKNFVEPV